MFEVLMFLFENYMDGKNTLQPNNQLIISELERVGFERGEIDRALDWLDGLNRFQDAIQKSPALTANAIRHYTIEEAELLGVEGRGFLLQLQQLNILDPMTREIVIDRLIALDAHEIHLGRIKWVVLMVLFHFPGKKSALSILQDMVLADGLDVLH